MAQAGGRRLRRRGHHGSRREMDAAWRTRGTPHRAPGPHARRDAGAAAAASGCVVVSRGGAGVSLSVDDVYAILDDVKDPEVPVLSVVELGIVRDVVIE